MIKIECVNTGTTKEVKPGTDLKKIAEIFNPELEFPILGALVNNKVKEMTYEVYKPKIIHFYDYKHKDGMRMYFRSLYFVLMKAVKRLYPNVNITIEHSVANGYYCEASDPTKQFTPIEIKSIKNEMSQIINEDLPFIREELKNSEAIQVFEKNNMPSKVRLFKQSPALYTSVYHLGELTDYFYGFLVPTTGCLKKFDLEEFNNGMLLRVPDRQNPTKLRPLINQDKMFEVLEEHKFRVEVLKAHNIGRINEQVINGESGELIKIGEALHEKKIAEIAERIKSQENTKLILISGPTSSGKTTFSKRLSIQLRVSGLSPVMISLDNYFVNRDDTPLDKDGEVDFEALEALDVDLFNSNINDLLEGKTVKLPKFDFSDGKRFYDGETLSINKNNIIIAEGIHALTPKLTEAIKNNIKYKIYVSALTQICIDSHNRIPTTDNRLLRRIIRDHKYRGYSAQDTLKRWDSVRRGEKRNIFPYQEEADVMFNSALLYELGVIKKHAEPLLRQIWINKPEYAEAQRLLKFLSYFKDIPEKEIPPTSILREFLGESSFKY